MKFWEALAEQTKKGGRIKRTHHFFSSTDEKILSSSLVSVDDINADDWELYEESVKTYTFMEAVKLMKDGKRVKRAQWNDSIRKEDDLYFYWSRIGSGRFCPTIGDAEANDWILVEDK